MELVEKANRSRWRKAITKSRFRKMPNSLMHGDSNDSVDDDNSSNNGEQNHSSGGLFPRSYSILNGRYGTYLFNKYNHKNKNNTNANADDSDDVILLPNVGLDSLVDFEPRPLRSFFSNKQPLLRILIINDKKYHLSKNNSTSSRNDFSNSKTSVNDVNQFNLNSNANSSSSTKANSKNTTSEIIDVSMSDLLDNLNEYADELTTEVRMRQSRSRSTSSAALATAAAVLADTIYNSNNKHVYNSSINNSNRIFHLNASNNNNNNQNTRSFNPRFPETVSVGNTNTANSSVHNSPLRTIAENGGGSTTNSTLSSTSSKILASTSQKLPQSQHELSTSSSTSVGGAGGKHNIHVDNYGTNSYSTNNYNNNMSQNNNNNNNNFEKIQELRGRDLCCVSRHINEVDIPVVLLRQHVCIFSIRYDVKAIVQAHRILFIGETSQDDFSGLKRHMNVFLDDDDSSSQHSLSSSRLHESEHEHRDIFRSTGGDTSNGNIRSSSNSSGDDDIFRSTGGNDNNNNEVANNNIHNHNNSQSNISGDNNVGNRNDESNTTDNSHTANNTDITDSVTNLTSTANNEKYTSFNSSSNTRYQSSGKDSIRMKSPRSVSISSTSFSPSFSTSTSTSSSSSTASSPLTKSRSMSQMPLQPNIGTRSGTVSFDHSSTNNNDNNSSNHSGNNNSINNSNNNSNRNSRDNRNNSHNNSSNNINGFGSSNNNYNDNDVLSKLDHFPFEVRAVEGLLSTVIGIHSNEYDNLCIESDPYFCALLPSSSSSASANKRPQASLLTLEQQETLRRIKEEMSDILTRIRFTTSMIRSLLENDEMLPFLCLKAFEKDPGLYQHYNNAPNKAEARRLLQTAVPASEINDIEFLLEYHLTECQQLEYEVSSTLKRLENAEQSILVRLNMSQNQLLIANTIVTVLAGSVAFGSFIAGLFGMNLDNDKYQTINGSFLAVTLLTLASVALIAVATIYYFQYTSMLPAQVVLENPMNRRLSSMNSNPASRRNTIDNSGGINNLSNHNNSSSNMGFGDNYKNTNESSCINDSNKRFQYKYSTIPENLIT